METAAIASLDIRAYCKQLVEKLRDSETPSRLLKKELIEHFYWAEDDELNALEQEVERLPFIWQLCSMTLEQLCQQGLSEDAFYERLVWFLLSSGLFSNEDERTIALFCILSNPRIPYKQFSDGNMPEDEFESRLDANQLEIRYLQQVAMRSFAQKTQQAHAAWEVLDQVADEDDRDVLLAMLLSFVKS